MEQPKEYYAFISYKREDEKWAKWLQDKLEHYKFPTNLNGRIDLPKHIRPTFRDVTDLKPGLLAEEITNALRNSEWLIVICSPRSAKSPWVCKEAQTFIDLGRADHIIPFVIEGNPFSNDTATECYPKTLLNLTGSKELLAANINEMGRDAAAIKVVARMFNLRFDALWQRYEREQRRKRWIWGSLAVFTALVGIMVALFFIHQNSIIQEKNRGMQVSQSRAIAEKIHTLIEEGDLFTAQLLALEILPNPDSNSPRAYTPEAEIALRDALAPLEIDGFKRVSRIRGRELGWRTEITDITMSQIEDVVYFVNGGFVYKHYLPTGEERQFESIDVRNRFGSLGLLDDTPIYLNKEETELCIIDFTDEKFIYYIWNTQNGNLLKKGEIINTSEDDIDDLTQVLDDSFFYKDVDCNPRIQIENLPSEIRCLINDEYENAYTSVSGNYIIVQGKVFSREKRRNLLVETRTFKYMPTTIEFSKDNKFLAIGDESGNISIIDLISLKKNADYSGASIPIQKLDFSNDGTILFVFACDSTHSELLLYNLNGEVMSHIKEESTIQDAFVDWGKGLLTTIHKSQNDTIFNINIWEINKKQFHPIRKFKINDNESMELWSPIWESTNSLLFLSGEGLTVNRLNINDNKLTKACATPMYTMGNGQDCIMDIQLIDNEKMILVAFQGDHQVMDRKSMAILYPIRHEGVIIGDSYRERENSHIQQYIATYCVPKGGTRLLTLSNGGVLRIHDIKTGLMMQLLELPCNVPLPYLSSAAISYDGSMVAYCYDGENIYLTKLPTLQTLINRTKASLKGRKLTSEEKRKYYLE